jgi:hypothetical protein
MVLRKRTSEQLVLIVGEEPHDVGSDNGVGVGEGRREREEEEEGEEEAIHVSVS